MCAHERAPEAGGPRMCGTRAKVSRMSMGAPQCRQRNVGYTGPVPVRASLEWIATVGVGWCRSVRAVARLLLRPGVGEQPTVGDGDSVGVARQVREHGRGTRERALGVDDPLALAQRRKPLRERVRVGEGSVLTEEAREHAHRQEEARLAADPAIGIEGQAAAGDDAVHVRVVSQRRAPCVQHQCDTDAGAEVLRVGGDRAQRLRGKIEQQAIHELLVGVGNDADGAGSVKTTW